MNEKGLEFTLGEISQSLKSQERSFKKLEDNQVEIFDKINEIKTTVVEHGMKIKDHMEFKLEAENRFGNDANRLSNLEKSTGINNGVKKESRATVVYVIGILMFLLVSASLVVAYKGLTKPTIIKLDKDFLEKLSR